MSGDIEVNIIKPCGKPETLTLNHSVTSQISIDKAKHILIEQICTTMCKYSGSCGYAHDWFMRHHRPVF